jgi:peptide/nickel transport system substrate-binding protein
MFRNRHKALKIIATLAVMGFVAAACSSSSKSATSSTTVSGGTTATTTGASPTSCPGDPPNQIYNSNSAGTPKTGGTLTVLGQGDVDEDLDVNIGYYTLDYLAYDLYNRPLYTYPSVQCKTFTLVPDIADGPPVVSDGGLKYAVTIRTGAMWNTNPPRQVTAADVVLGVKRSCNPITPFGGQPDFSDILAGYQDFCNGFQNVGNVAACSAANPGAACAQAIAAYINSNQISGVQVDPSNPLTVDFTLTKPAAYFEGILSLPPFNPAPIESLQSVPGKDPNAYKNVYSDGPYEIQSYNPGQSITFVRNPVWSQSVDPVDHAYVDQIDVSETGTDTGIFQQILTNSPQADMQWDVHVPASDIPAEIANHDPRFQLLTESAVNPWLVFNTVSPNNNHALANVQVRQALSYAIDRAQLIQDEGGSSIAVPLTHIIAPGTDAAKNFPDFYPYNPAKAKAMLAAAGFPHLTLKYLYRQSATNDKDYQALQAQLAQIGVNLVKISAPSGSVYGQYLNPGKPAQQGAWDIANAGWGPDWFPNGAKSWFVPTLDGNFLPPNSSNFGFFNDPTLNNLINEALAAPTESAAIPLWQQADAEAMKQAAVYPITDPNEGYIEGSQVHNCVIIQPLQNCNLANVWLSS